MFELKGGAMRSLICWLLFMTGCARVNGISNCDCQDPASGCVGSPIILDMAGDGIHLTTASDGVPFALVPGQVRQWSWTDPNTDDAWLVLDRDENGTIDDGSEMFGDHTEQPASETPNGFAALSVFDDNSDRRIDEHDLIWPRLQLWRDINHDGIGQLSELTAIAANGVRGIDLDYKRVDSVDADGNQYRFSAHVEADPPVGRFAYDVWLRALPLESAQRIPVPSASWKCWAWGYFRNLDNTSCDLPTVQNDPLLTDGTGYLTRMVARFSTASDARTAVLRAQNIVETATNHDYSCDLLPSPDYCTGRCLAGSPPVNDFLPPPYYSVYSDVRIRSKCEEPHETTCDNTLDDDGDGLTDCADPDCAGSPHCSSGGGGGGSCY